MEMSQLVTIGIFLLTNIGVWAGVVISIRIDMREVKVNIDAIEKQMEKFANVLITLANFKGEMNLQAERITALVKRLDDTVTINNARELRYEAQLDQLKTGELRRSEGRS